MAYCLHWLTSYEIPLRKRLSRARQRGRPYKITCVGDVEMWVDPSSRVSQQHKTLKCAKGIFERLSLLENRAVRKTPTPISSIFKFPEN